MGSQRMAATELRSHHKEIGRWFRELQHYSFIVMSNPGCLGVNGKGRAPSWRLTELGCMKELPTRDYARWNGTLFDPPKHRPVAEKRHTHRSPKKQNPVTEKRHTPWRKSATLAWRKSSTLPRPTVAEK